MKIEDQQPLIFGLITKHVVNSFGDEGTKAIQEAVCLYGRRRGGRMAEAARRYGYDKNLLSYLLFGEFDVAKAGSVMKINKRNPYLEVHMMQCHWYTVWNEFDLLDYGKLYCADIDRSLMDGFDINVRLSVERNPSGYPLCVHKFYDWPLKITTTIKYYIKKSKIAKVAQKEWNYHAADLYEVFSRAVINRLGKNGKDAIKKAEKEFAEKFGEETLNDMLILAKKTDFSRP
jgi:hypothetical protein